MYKKLFYCAWWKLEKEQQKKERTQTECNGSIAIFWDPYNANVGVFNVPGSLRDCPHFFFFFFSIFLYSVVRQWFPPFCLPGHLSVLLSEFFCCRLLPLYCSSLFFSSLCSFSCVPLFATLWTVEPQAPLSMGFSKAEYWSGLPYPPPGDLPGLGIGPESSPALAGGFLLVVVVV